VAASDIDGVVEVLTVLDGSTMVSRVRGLSRADRPGIMDAGIARAHGLSQASLALVRERRGHAREAWMAEATRSGIAELARFARGLEDNLVAIKAGLTLEWSNGVTEGQIHRLKLLKRQGYGRAGFALVRQRVLQAT
jgi:transposase